MEDLCATPATDWISAVSRNYYQHWPAHQPGFCAHRKIQRAGNRTERPFLDWQEHQRSQTTSIYQTLYFWPSGGNAPGPLHSEKQKQGLMQVYQDFCTQNENNCLHCTFPNVVNRYFSLKNLKNASIPLRNHSISPKIDIPLDCIEHSR